jgi:hypothetical protein
MNRRILVALGATMLLLSGVMSGTALAAGPSVKVLASGLDNPRGVAVGTTGNVFVAEGGTGATGSGKIAVWRHGSLRTAVSGLPSVFSPEGDISGPTNVAARGNGTLAFTIGGGPQGFDTLRRATPTRILADIQAYRNAHPKPACQPNTNPEIWCDLDQPANPTDSNAYGLALVPGGALVTDAAGDQLLLVSANGHIQSVAKFPNEIVSTSHIPGFPVPAVPAEPVPTTVAVGPDGAWYVGELKGFPFTPGASRIWRIAPSARNVTCDPTATSGACTLFADGFTSVTGMAFGPDGSLYVVEIVKNGVLGLFSGTDVTGALIRYKAGVQTELVAGQLTAPGDVAVSRTGALYVSNKSVCTGTGQPVPALCGDGGELLQITP